MTGIPAPVPGPGFVNAHTHIYSALAPLGMPVPKEPPQNFVQILERIWWRLDRALDARSLVASARLYAAESVLRGTTTLIDHHESPNLIEGSLDLIADACQELGIRSVLTFGATERNDGPAEAARGLAECRRFALTNRRPLVRGLVGLHASFTVSDDTLSETAALCRELDLPAHVHVAEDVADVEDARRRGSAGPLERMLRAGALPPGSVLAHGVHLAAAQVRVAGAAHCWLVQNPRSNEGNRVGYPRHLAASGLVALGTDGYPADMLEEYAALERLAREHEPATPRAVLRGRLDGGRALAAERFGPHELRGDTVEFERLPGAGAKDAPRPPLRAWRVLVGGRTVVENGRLLTADLEEIRVTARACAASLWQRMEEL
jgi:cytosine/adenosine deaminase-related metal-dependent hydrolase